MALVRLNDIDRDSWDLGDHDIDFGSFNVYSDGGDQVGSVYDALMDEQSGRIRYLIVDTGFWVFGKKVLLPIGLARFDYDDSRVYANGLTKDQVEELPEFNDDLRIDHDYEERVRGTYRPIAAQRTTGTSNLGQNRQSTTAATSATTSATTPAATPRTPAVTPKTPATSATSANDYTMASGAYGRDTYDYDREPGLYGYDQENNQRLRLYEERLTANKARRKTGDVRVGKHVETQNAEVSVPVEKERVIVERNVPTDARSTTQHDFQSGEVARMDVYEETANVQKQAFVREEVNIHKEVEHDTVSTQEQLRREELDVETEGRPTIERPNRGV